MVASASALLLVLAAALASIVGAFIQKHVEILAPKGKFMVHMLHSAYFFPQTVEVKWSASAQGKPSLPVWLHLFRSRHRAIAYLIGTPVTPISQVTIHVIAKRLDNYRSAEQFVTINLNDDARYNSSTHQIAELRIRNVAAEDFVGPRENKIHRLEKAIHQTFRGKGVNPYIFNIFPEIRELPEDFYRVSHKRKIASIVQIGTQRGFHPNVHSIVNGLNSNSDYCGNSNYIPMNKYFRDSFDVDWCKFDLKNMTMVKALERHAQDIAVSSKLYKAEKSAIASELQVEKARSRKNMEDMDVLHRNFPLRTQSLFESVLVFPLLAILCIILVIALSLIFFGRREGQHWRDYKTPKERLQEYLDVRESQRHLREMSVQRQILFMSDEGGKSPTPMSINTFLKPRQSPVVSFPSPQMNDGSFITPHVALSASSPRLPTASPASSHQQSSRRAHCSSAANAADAYRTPRSSVGKQTVADAARATGSSLHLYRNPLEDDRFDGCDAFERRISNYYDAEQPSRTSNYNDRRDDGATLFNYRTRSMLSNNCGPLTDYRYSTVR